MKKRILIVDDEFDDLLSMKAILEKEGYCVTTVTNGERALDILRSTKQDLVLIDILMPGLSGYEVLALIKEKINHNIKMLYISIVPKKEVDLNGSNGFIQKPFSPKVLLSKVRSGLRK